MILKRSMCKKPSANCRDAEEKKCVVITKKGSSCAPGFNKSLDPRRTVDGD